MSMDCPSCGIQLNEDGTVDTLAGEPDQHYADCTAVFEVIAYDKAGNTAIVYGGPNGKPFDHYRPARDIMRQRRAMSGPRLDWRIE